LSVYKKALPLHSLFENRARPGGEGSDRRKSSLKDLHETLVVQEAWAFPPSCPCPLVTGMDVSGCRWVKKKQVPTINSFLY